MNKIYWAEPSLGEEELEIVQEVIKSGWIGGNGPLTKRFEKEFANKVNSRYAIAVSSGTSGLITALLALKELETINEMFVSYPTFTFIATANTTHLIADMIDLVDCNKKTFNIEVDNIHRKSNVIIPVDVGGLPCDYDTFRKLDGYILEDAAEALGAKYGNKMIGSIADITVFSLHAAKIVTTGEGGMITTDSKLLYEIMRSIVNQGFSSDRKPWEYEHIMRGYNFRITELQSALGLVQLKKLDKYLRHREEIANIYRDILGDRVKYQYIPSDRKTSNFLFPILVNPEKQIKICKELFKRGIQVKITWKPVHLQKPYSQLLLIGDNSEYIWKRIISLPIHNKLTEEETKYVAENVKELL